MRAISILFIFITSLALLSDAAPAQDSSNPKDATAPNATPAIEATETYDVGYGTFEVPDDFVFKHTGTKDSYRGTLTRKSDGFTINFDIGEMAGIHISDRDKAKYSFYRTHRIGGFSAITGIQLVTDVRQITTTVAFDVKTRRAPANFWADIRKDSDIADFLLVVTTYRSKSRGS